VIVNVHTRTRDGWEAVQECPDHAPDAIREIVDTLRRSFHADAWAIDAATGALASGMLADGSPMVRVPVATSAAYTETGAAYYPLAKITRRAPGQILTPVRGWSGDVLVSIGAAIVGYGYGPALATLTTADQIRAHVTTPEDVADHVRGMRARGARDHEIAAWLITDIAADGTSTSFEAALAYVRAG